MGVAESANIGLVLQDSDDGPSDMERLCQVTQNFFVVVVVRSSSRGTQALVVAESAVATVDHSDIRGSKPHNRDPSGAASD